MKYRKLEIRLNPVDSLYFRGSRPHSAAGATALKSEFPPAESSVVGALRTRLGEAVRIDWKLFAQDPNSQQISGLNANELIGTASDTGLLDFSNTFIVKNNQRLYPVPAVLLEAPEGLVKLELGELVHCDLGKVRLPQLPENIAHAKPIENSWITQEGLAKFLEGNLPNKSDLVRQEDLVKYENRLGIARNLELATVKSGMLYQTEHLRFAEGVGLGVQLSLPEAVADKFIEDIEQNPMQRFGGEGRMVELRLVDELNSLEVKSGSNPNLLMLLTPLQPDEIQSPVPLSGFTQAKTGEVDCWEGNLQGINLRVFAMANNKAKLFGGWDIQANQAKPMVNYLPAGSCFFVEPLDGGDLTQLNLVQIGKNTLSGYGQLVVATL